MARAIDFQETGSDCGWRKMVFRCGRSSSALSYSRDIKEILMRVRTLLVTAAASVALGFGSLCFGGDVSGSAKLDGKAPEQRPIDMSGVKDCNDMHPDPVVEEN